MGASPENSLFRADSLVDCIVRTRPRVGESGSGDAAIVHRVGGIFWAVVIDGLGHGPPAQLAAERGREVILGIEKEDLRVLQLLARLHAALQGTRGAAATIARFDRFGVEFGGVGNVALLGLCGQDLPYTPVGGVLGCHCGPPRSRRIPLSPGSRLLLLSDGISRRAPVAKLDHLEAEVLCATLMHHYASEDDDATLIHIAYHGGENWAGPRTPRRSTGPTSSAPGSWR